MTKVQTEEVQAEPFGMPSRPSNYSDLPELHFGQQMRRDDDAGVVCGHFIPFPLIIIMVETCFLLLRSSSSSHPPFSSLPCSSLLLI